MNYEVKEVKRSACEDLILNVHYAKRWPSVSYAFGLFKDGELAGIVTYGTPPSANVRKSIAGECFKGDVLELNRLCMYKNEPNNASMLVGRSLKLLPKGKIVISFADTSEGHVGYVYQATNFLYYGLSAKRVDWRVRGKEHLHPQTITDEFRGVKNRAQAMREKYGDDYYPYHRPRKHRYVYITGSKSYKKAVKRSLKYEIKPYPKI
tara:strand:+ start:31686 stop:32306 length:621 start_codon:yes stop_codon:yes gene_type:complete